MRRKRHKNKLITSKAITSQEAETDPGSRFDCRKAFGSLQSVRFNERRELRAMFLLSVMLVNLLLLSPAQTLRPHLETCWSLMFLITKNNKKSLCTAHTHLYKHLFFMTSANLLLKSLVQNGC